MTKWVEQEKGYIKDNFDFYFNVTVTSWWHIEALPSKQMLIDILFWDSTLNSPSNEAIKEKEGKLSRIWSNWCFPGEFSLSFTNPSYL